MTTSDPKPPGFTEEDRLCCAHCPPRCRWNNEHRVLCVECDDEELTSQTAAGVGTVHVVVGDPVNGYRCPKDNTVLTLIHGRAPGAWCPRCETVYTELAEFNVPQHPLGGNDD